VGEILDVMPGSRRLSVEPRFLTLNDVAVYLSISPTLVYALVRSGELPAVKIATPARRGVWRVDRNELEKYIERLHEQTRAGMEEHPRIHSNAYPAVRPLVRLPRYFVHAMIKQ
jgi:prophage regulatory protein